MRKASQLISLVGLIFALSVLNADAQQNQATGLAWGSNAYGQFGNGTLTNSPTPVPVSNLSGLTAVAGGGGHSLWLKSDGTVWASGLNNVGQLGSGGAYPNCPASSTTPVQVSSLSGVAAIAGGFTHSVALKSDGTVWVWGEGLDGEMGNGVVARSCTPVQSNISGVVAIAAGDFHNVALKSDGTVWAWGFNINGQLGNGTSSGSAVPVQVSNLSGVVAIAAGGDNGMAVKSDGTAWVWGQGTDGELGNGTTTNSSTPVQVSNLSGVARVASGIFAPSVLALKTDGTVWAWGSGATGQLGNGTTSSSTTPVQVSGLSGITAIGGGEGFHLALKSDGTVWAWGAIAGNGALTSSLTPVQVSNLSGATGIAAGRGFSLAIGVFTAVPLTITADNTTRPYGQANPVLTASYNGFVGGDNPAVLSGTLSCTTTATANSPMGNYPIMCSGQTSTKYTITYVAGQLTITPAPLTITANNATRPYGQANPVFTATYSGFVNGETPSVLSGTLSCTSNATPSSPVSISSYAINCSGQSSTNYAITYAAGNLMITALSASVTPTPASKTYGSADPTFTGALAGFLASDNVTAAYSRNPGEAAGGNYTIGATLGPAGVLGNYNITYNTASFTINKATLLVTADNKAKILDAANPSFTATYSGFKNGETLTTSGVSGNPSLTTAATTTSPVGTYPIIAALGTLAAGNYTFVFGNGTLTVLYASGGVCDGDAGHSILPPINADGTTVGNQGRTIPAKFRVCDANGVSIGTPGVVASFYLTQIITATVTTNVVDIVNTNNPDSAFRWDPTVLQWIFNITTSNLAAGSTYIYTITLNDGSTISFQYGLR